MSESTRTSLLTPARASLALFVDRTGRNRAIAMLVLATLAALGLVMTGLGHLPKHAPVGPRPHGPMQAVPAAAIAAASVPIVEPQAFEELTAGEAEARNAERPLAKRPLEPARPFVMPAVGAGSLEWNRAINCLALAAYYEAAGEGAAGMRAVSQVVLNRLRHPAFPKSVCEVVFQGSERSTGCQFTFTCDGSLTRPAVPALMARARAVASAALQGTVDRSIGMATHYHTRQVVPYWAESLDKIRVIGAHIFYVWRGTAGSRAAFQGVYAGEGSPVADAYLPAEQRPGQGAAPSALAFKDSARQVDPNAAGGSRAKRTFLVADETAKGLLADEGGPGQLAAQPLIHLSAQRIAPEPR